MVSFHPCKELGKNIPGKSASQCEGLMEQERGAAGDELKEGRG